MNSVRRRCSPGQIKLSICLGSVAISRTAKVPPVVAKALRSRKRPVGSSWRVDETHVKVGGQWKYLFRAVDRLGCTMDFLLTANRDMVAARRFFERAINQHDVPEKVTIDKSGANTARPAVHNRRAFSTRSR